MLHESNLETLVDQKLRWVLRIRQLHLNLEVEPHLVVQHVRVDHPFVAGIC
jgi:hypothetical protein